MPKFSIIIPCYNVEKYIAECLDSLLIQKETSWEAICTNDGSTDRTGAILDEYAQKDSRIKVIHQENKGLSEARNAALNVAVGEWLYYLDSDDVLSPWALETYAHMSKDFPTVDILSASFVNTPIIAPSLWEKYKKRYLKDLVNFYPKGEALFKVVCEGDFQKNLFKREFYQDIPWVGLSWCEERPYIAKCVVKSQSIAQIDVLCYGRREREGSITQSKMSLAECNGYLDATLLILQIFKNSNCLIPYSLHRSLINKCLEFQPRFIMCQLTIKDRKEAWNYWFKSLKLLKNFPPISYWQKFVISFCIFFRFKWVAFCLCFLPDLLKRKGFHR